MLIFKVLSASGKTRSTGNIGITITAATIISNIGRNFTMLLSLCDILHAAKIEDTDKAEIRKLPSMIKLGKRKKFPLALAK